MAQKREHTRHRARFHSPTGPRTRSTLGGDEARAARGRASPGPHTDSHGRCSRPAACPWTLLPRAPGALRASDARSADFITPPPRDWWSGSGAPARVPPGNDSLGRAESTQGAHECLAHARSLHPHPAPGPSATPRPYRREHPPQHARRKAVFVGPKCFLLFKGLAIP